MCKSGRGGVIRGDFREPNRVTAPNTNCQLRNLQLDILARASDKLLTTFWASFPVTAPMVAMPLQCVAVAAPTGRVGIIQFVPKLYPLMFFVFDENLRYAAPVYCQHFMSAGLAYSHDILLISCYTVSFNSLLENVQVFFGIFCMQKWALGCKEGASGHFSTSLCR